MKINENRLKKILATVSLELLFLAAIFLLAAFTFTYLVEEVVYGEKKGFDERVNALLQPHITLQVVRLMMDVTFFGSAYFLLPAYFFIIGVFLLRKELNKAADVFVIALSSTMLMFVLKKFFHRQRPALPLLKDITNYSFPSGHALSTFVFCSILGYLVYKSNWSTTAKLATIAILVFFTLLVGLSRIILRVHYASDVIAGLCLGVVWVITSFWILRMFRINRKRRQIQKAVYN